MLSTHSKQAASILAALTLTAAACSGQDNNNSSPDLIDAVIPVGAYPTSEDAAAPSLANADADAAGLLRQELTSAPLMLVGAHGTADVSAYLELDAANLSAFPEVTTGDPIQRWDGNFLRIRDPKLLVATASLAIRVEIIDFGLPRFNSDSGGYWTPGLHEESGVVDVANEIWREVKVRVTDVLGDALDSGVRPGDTIVFISRGGQVRVEPADVATAPGNRDVPEEDHPHEIASLQPFVIQSMPPVDLTKGEDAIVLLDWSKFKGLYDGRYGYRFELMPSNEILYKYVIEGDTAVNIGDPDGSLTMPLSSLQELIDRHLGISAGESPRPGVFPADPHPKVDPNSDSPVDDVNDPDHTHGE